MRKSIIPLVFVLLLVACAGPLAAGSPAEPVGDSLVEPIADVAGAGHLECPICEIDMTVYAGPLSEAEVQGLLLALNDEYYAWAVYDQVLQDYGDARPFVNIKVSEARHIEALQGLFASYDLPLPENPWIGWVPRFGSVSEACATGVDAETANVALYDRLLASTQREDILKVYASLQRASQENHLLAFTRCAR